jgi:hypothetical protein
MKLFLVCLFLVIQCFADPLAIVRLKERDGGIMEAADFAFSTGFNVVFVPLQKTQDEYPRFVVSNNQKISQWTMLEYHQHEQPRGSFTPLLGEFLSGTADTLKTLLIPIQAAEDVDSIVHELSLSPRSSDSFLLVLPHNLSEIRHDQSDAISRYRGLVPGGDIILFKEDYKGEEDETTQLIQRVHRLEINKIAVPYESCNAELVEIAHFNNVTVGVFDANSKEQIQLTIQLGVDFFTTQEPLNYLTMTSKKTKKNVIKGHAAVFFG